MDNIILQMLAEYDCRSAADYENALREIIQEIALLGLWRARFYEHALFYGGSSLRILYGLTRFSEDLDFSLLQPAPDFNFSKYHAAIVAELTGFGFVAEVQKKDKSVDSQIDSAFIKAGTRINFVKIKVPEGILNRIHHNQNMKIKIDVDLDPPGRHGVEVLDIFRPIPFQVKTMPLADLFAGKMHALLARSWRTRVKGRDYYDYLWYLGKKSPINLGHLEARLQQSGHLTGPLTKDMFREMLHDKFMKVDIESAKRDIAPFLKDREKAALALWSNEYFMKTVNSVECVACC